LNFTAAELRQLAAHVEGGIRQDIVDFDNCNACKALAPALREYAALKEDLQILHDGWIVRANAKSKNYGILGTPYRRCAKELSAAVAPLLTNKEMP
jgi:hypothetical protein